MYINIYILVHTCTSAKFSTHVKWTLAVCTNGMAFPLCYINRIQVEVAMCSAITHERLTRPYAASLFYTFS
jgi:hypothetical protein